MRSHKVYSRSTLPNLQPSQQQQQRHHHHHHHHQRHSVTSRRKTPPSPEMLRAPSQHLSMSSSLAAAARRRSSPSSVPLRMKSLAKSRAPPPLEPLKAGHRIDPQERVFLEAAEHGDKPTVQRCLQGPQPVNVNCTNILGRSAIQVTTNNTCYSPLILSPYPPVDNTLSNDVCPEDKRKDYQNCSAVLYCVQQLYTVIRADI